MAVTDYAKAISESVKVFQLRMSRCRCFVSHGTTLKAAKKVAELPRIVETPHIDAYTAQSHREKLPEEISVSDGGAEVSCLVSQRLGIAPSRAMGRALPSCRDLCKPSWHGLNYGTASNLAMFWGRNMT